MKNEVEIIQELKKEVAELKSQVTTLNTLRNRTFIERGRYDNADVSEVAVLPGIYYFGNGCTNLPPSSSNYCKIINLETINNDNFQLGIGITSGKISCRLKKSNMWQEWKDLH